MVVLVRYSVDVVGEMRETNEEIDAILDKIEELDLETMLSNVVQQKLDELGEGLFARISK